MLGDVPDFAGVEEGFRGHASAQDAETSYILTSFHDTSTQALSARGPGSGVSGTASPQDEDIVIKRAVLAHPVESNFGQLDLEARIVGPELSGIGYRHGLPWAGPVPYYALGKSGSLRRCRVQL